LKIDSGGYLNSILKLNKKEKNILKLKKIEYEESTKNINPRNDKILRLSDANFASSAKTPVEPVMSVVRSESSDGLKSGIAPATE
jgi:hypothetical protein